MPWINVDHTVIDVKVYEKKDASYTLSTLRTALPTFFHVLLN